MDNVITLLGLKLEIWAFIISLIALMFTFLKDFILPWYFKPKIEFTYENKPPFRREDVTIDKGSNLKGTFLRFSVKNVGRRPALNCRCQILKVNKGNNIYGDYQGFPLRWASRPESLINQTSGERLNLGIGETEFIDLAASTNKDNFIYLQKYHNIDIGIKEVIECGKYNLFLIFSGDNLEPYFLHFTIDRKDSIDHKAIHAKLKKS